MAGIGIMEGAYFVGRGELLTWINSFLGLNYTKIEQLASGVAHIQIFNSIYPGEIPIGKVILDAKHEWEYIKNLKQLQEAFIRLNIDKVVDIGRLSKAKYQDNLEFTQWIKRYWDLHYRGEWKPPAEITVKLECGRAEANATRPAKAAAIAARKTESSAAPARARVLAQHNTTASSPKRVPATNKKEKDTGPTPASMQLLLETMERERDFYFDKLREIEILFQSQPEDAPPAVQQLKAHVINILTCTAETPVADKLL